MKFENGGRSILKVVTEMSFWSILYTNFKPNSSYYFKKIQRTKNSK